MEHYDFWRRRSRKEQTRGKTTATTVSINTFQASNRRIDIRYVIRTCCRIVTCPRYSRFQRILYQRYPEPRVMQTRKIVIASLSLLIVGLALPAVSLPPANAFHNGTIAVTVGGILQTFTLQFADAQRVASMLSSLVQQGLYRPGLPAGVRDDEARFRAFSGRHARLLHQSGSRSSLRKRS